MHPDFLQMRIDERQRELEEQVRSAFVAPPGGRAAAGAEPEAVVLRLCSVHDDEALERIAALEGLPVAAGRHVVAEVDGAIVASLPLAGGVRAGRSVPRDGPPDAAARAAREAAHAGARATGASSGSGAPSAAGAARRRSVGAGQGERGRGGHRPSRHGRRPELPRAAPPSENSAMAAKTYAVLLRGINVGGKNKLADARAAHAARGRRLRGRRDVHPERERRAPELLARGRSCSGRSRSRSRTSSRWRSAWSSRTPVELERIADANPFLAGGGEPTGLHVVFLDRAPGGRGDRDARPGSLAGRRVQRRRARDLSPATRTARAGRS